MASRADRVRKILHLPNAEIARRIGCPESYVRTVRQRTASDGLPQLAAGERAYVASPHGKARSREASRAWNKRHPEYAEHKREYSRRRWRNDPAYRAAHCERVRRRRERLRTEARA